MDPVYDRMQDLRDDSVGDQWMHLAQTGDGGLTVHPALAILFVRSAVALDRIADALGVLTADKRLEARHQYEGHRADLLRWQQTDPGVDEEGDDLTQYTIDYKIRQYSERVANLEWAHPWLKEG